MTQAEHIINRAGAQDGKHPFVRDRSLRFADAGYSQSKNGDSEIVESQRHAGNFAARPDGQVFSPPLSARA